MQEWLANVGEGVPGYVTPKVAVGRRGRQRLAARSCSCSAPTPGIWLYPTGWADIGYSPSEIAVKEVAEETGIECEPVRLLSVIDGQRLGFTRFGMYMLLFYCRATGGELRPHPLETSDVGWFGEHAMPEHTAGAAWWGPMAFAAIQRRGVADRVRLTAQPGVAPLIGTPHRAGRRTGPGQGWALAVGSPRQESRVVVAEEALDLVGEVLGIGGVESRRRRRRRRRSSSSSSSLISSTISSSRPT